VLFLLPMRKGRNRKERQQNPRRMPKGPPDAKSPDFGDGNNIDTCETADINMVDRRAVEMISCCRSPLFFTRTESRLVSISIESFFNGNTFS
jgi:hypothetical protein